MTVLNLPSGATVSAVPGINAKEINETGNALPKLKEILEKHVGDVALDENFGVIFEGSAQYIEPIFTYNEDIRNGSAGRARKSDLIYQSDNWCGSAGFPYEALSYFKTIAGQWVVPSISSTVKNVKQHLSIWVGIDGWGSTDVFQGGTAANVIDNGSGDQAEYYFWTEWFPDAEVRNNLPVAPEDTIYCVAAAINLQLFSWCSSSAE